MKKKNWRRCRGCCCCCCCCCSSSYYSSSYYWYHFYYSFVSYIFTDLTFIESTKKNLLVKLLNGKDILEVPWVPRHMPNKRRPFLTGIPPRWPFPGSQRILDTSKVNIIVWTRVKRFYHLPNLNFFMFVVNFVSFLGGHKPKSFSTNVLLTGYCGCLCFFHFISFHKQSIINGDLEPHTLELEKLRSLCCCFTLKDTITLDSWRQFRQFINLNKENKLKNMSKQHCKIAWKLIIFQKKTMLDI